MNNNTPKEALTAETLIQRLQRRLRNNSELLDKHNMIDQVKENLIEIADSIQSAADEFASLKVAERHQENLDLRMQFAEFKEKMKSQLAEKDKEMEGRYAERFERSQNSHIAECNGLRDRIDQLIATHKENIDQLHEIFYIRLKDAKSEVAESRKENADFIGFKDDKPVLFSNNSYSPILIKDSQDILIELMGNPCHWSRSKKTPITAEYKVEIRCDDSYSLCGDMKYCEACGAFPIAVISKVSGEILSTEKETDAIEFAQWISSERWSRDLHGDFERKFAHQETEVLSARQLYNKFIEGKLKD